MACQDSVDAGARRRIGFGFNLQCLLDRLGPVFAQDAVFAQLPAQFQNSLFHRRIQSIPGNRAPRCAVTEISPIQTFAFCSLHPEGHFANTHTKLSCYRSHTLSGSHLAYHFSALLFWRNSLLMKTQSKKAKTYFNCSTIAEPQVFNDR
jgi:hypothetical protein